MASETTFMTGMRTTYFYRHYHCSVQKKDSELRLIRWAETVKENVPVFDKLGVREAGCGHPRTVGIIEVFIPCSIADSIGRTDSFSTH